MKKVIMALAVLTFSISIFSCSNDSLAESDALYDTHATEGDDIPDFEDLDDDN